MGYVQIAAAVVSAVVSAVGAGMQAYSQREQANQAQEMANYNYAVQQQNAKLQRDMALQQAYTNQRVAASQYQAGLNNAQALQIQAAAVQNRGQEEVKRIRTENERVLALQRAKQAKSGVTMSEGSPLLVMADIAGQLELKALDARYKSDLEVADLRRSAETEKYKAGFSLMEEGVQKYQEAATRAGYALELQNAKINRLQGYYDAQALRAKSTQTLISGVAQGFSSASSIASSAGW